MRSRSSLGDVSGRTSCDGRVFRPVEADVSDRESLKGLPEAEHRALRGGLRSRGRPVPRGGVVVEGLRNVLDSLSPGTERIVFVSSTGVMGGHDGGWVRRGGRVCRPQRESGRCGLDAEVLLGESPHWGGVR